MSRLPDGVIEYVAWFTGLFFTLSGAAYFNETPIYAIVLFALGIFCNIACKPCHSGIKGTIYWGYIALLYLFCVFGMINN